MKNYFFISYAADEDRRWVQRFHADLEYELRVQVGSAVGGILDTRPRPGMDADLALAAGAGGTRVMVALCSDPFFRDAWCGREWEVFHSRIENFSKAGATRLEDGFLRVLWRPTQDPVPAVATRDLADASAGLPDTYRQRGLLWMMRKMLLGAGGYYWFVRMLAARIVAAQQITLDPVPDLAVRRAAAAFGSHPGSSGDPSEAMPPFLPLAGSVNGNGNVNGNGRAGFRTHGDGDEARRAASIGTAPPVPTPTTTSRRTTPPVASDVPSPQTPLAEVSRLVAISYVGADQEWADWLEYLLRRGSHRVVQVRWAQSRGERLAETVDRIAARRPDVTVALLSRHYRPPRPENPGETEIEAWERLGLAGPLENQVIRAVIDREPLPEPLRTLPKLDLSRFEPTAVDGLLAGIRAGARR